MDKDNYISIKQFARRYKIKEETVKKNLHKIKGYFLKNDNIFFFDSARYPYNIRNSSKKKRLEKIYIILKATEMSMYIDHEMLECSKSSFTTMLKELEENNLLQKNGTNDFNGANAYDTTMLAGEKLKEPKKELIKSISDILGRLLVK